MDRSPARTCTAFDQTKKIASGPLKDVAVRLKDYQKKNPKSAILIFDDVTSQQVEIDLRGSVETVLQRLEDLEPALEGDKKQGPGRPKLGVVAREVTLLPQHWDWLSHQPGGASITLRKLVDEARKKNLGKDQLRQAQDAAYKFMTAMAGDMPHYEEALRALFAKDAVKFSKIVSDWPKDVRDHTLMLAKAALPGK